ncbi:MAG: DUF3473 domain-containing protein [Deltaproteobacteria bacterium]|nr:DUF3473 domain-containing protein [Deltaproteobacteria bacterium]MCB9487545.1 DUF3473 domain-containing protein [Deltaproteobacteria bacterium]
MREMNQANDKPMRFAFTVDVEEWFQVENLRPAYPLSSWEGAPSRVEASVDAILRLFADEGVTGATFFTLGCVAERHPDMIRRIAQAGFEVASHGMDHVTNFDDAQTKDKLRWNLSASKALLAEITGQDIVGYRAPSFTVDNEVLDEVRAAGYRYDSSFNDVSWHDRYGRVDLTGFEEIEPGVMRDANGFCEIPIRNLTLAGKTIPWGGGGYFRLLPAPVYRWGVRRTVRRTGSFMFYMHPWEVDPDQPRVDSLSMTSRFRHYNHLADTLPRLRAMARMLRGMGVNFVSAAELADAAPDVQRKSA